MVAYMNERKQSGRRIAEFQANQFLLADLASDLAMIELWLDYVAELVDGGAPDFGLEASIAKMRASDLAMRDDDRRGADARRLWLLPRLPRRAPDARRQDHPDLGRHEPDPPTIDRQEFRIPMTGTIRTVGVCGAGGTMGAGIAIVAARAGFRTISFDVGAGPPRRARAAKPRRSSASPSSAASSPADERDAIMAALTRPTTDLAELGECDLVIEAMFEDLQVKRKLLGQLDAICPPETIFASNTSTLSITEIAAGCSRPDRVIGMHFCLPAQLMKLIEVSPGLLTVGGDARRRPGTGREKCGQMPVKTQDRPGFILNALLVPFNNDCIRAVEAGVADAGRHRSRDQGGLGYKMGPLELIDLIGLDTQVRLCEALLSGDARSALRRAAAVAPHGRGGTARPQDRARLFRLRRRQDVWSVTS